VILHGVTYVLLLPRRVHVVEIVKGSHDHCSPEQGFTMVAATQPVAKRSKSYELGGRYRPQADLNLLGRAQRSSWSWVCIYRRARRIFRGRDAIAARSPPREFVRLIYHSSGLKARTFDYLDQIRPTATTGSTRRMKLL
jgi:hypothetical protein